MLMIHKWKSIETQEADFDETLFMKFYLSVSEYVNNHDING